VHYIHIQTDAQTSAQEAGNAAITLGDVYASVADGDLLFKDDFEQGLTKWRGLHKVTVPRHARIVNDPLCKNKDKEAGCRGKVRFLDVLRGFLMFCGVS
jgi:hypothetical protein